MLRHATRISVLVAMLVLAGSTGSWAQVLGDVHMRGGGGGSIGGSNPGPVDEASYKAIAGRIDTVKGLLEKIAGHMRALEANSQLAASPELLADVETAIDDVNYFGDLVTEAWEITAAGRTPGIKWDDQAPLRFASVERKLNSASEQRYALWWRVTDYINTVNRAWHGEAIGVSVDVKNPEDEDDIIPLREAAADLRNAVMGFSAELGQTAHTGYSIRSAHEPFLAHAGRTSVSLAYNYWPANEEGTLFEGYATGVLDLSAEFSLTNQLAVGVRLPFLVTEDVPAESPEQKTGLGDISLHLRYWLNGSERLGSKLQVGFGVAGVLPTSSEPEEGELRADRGVGFLNADFRAAIVPAGRGLPRLHARLARSQEFDDDVAQNSTELVVGALWSLDRWRLDAMNRFFNVGAWVDVAGTFYDDSQLGALGEAVDSAWDLRLGVSVFRLTRRASGAELRHSISGEIHRGLDEATRSSTLSGMLAYQLTF